MHLKEHTRKPTSVRFRPDYAGRVKQISELTGMSRARVLEIALDKLAQEMGLPPLTTYVPNLAASHAKARVRATA